MIVFASVGTDVHPFNRLVRWLDRWAATHTEHHVTVQYGTSQAPAFANGFDYLEHEQLLEWMQKADAIVSHGGPSTITEIREKHGIPIVVPRDPRRGEHVDEHQVRFCDLMNGRGLVDLAASAEDLGRHLESRVVTPTTPQVHAHRLPVGVEGFAAAVAPLVESTRRQKQR